MSFALITERKESKASIINTEEIDIQTGLAATTAGTTTATATAASSSPQPLQAVVAVVPTPHTTVHEENEKTGETNDVSDKK